VSPVKYEMGSYIPKDDILHIAEVKTANLTTLFFDRSCAKKD
jgi:hypothetical protein